MRGKYETALYRAWVTLEVLWDEDDAQTWIAERMELGSHGSSHVDLKTATLVVRS